MQVEIIPIQVIEIELIVVLLHIHNYADLIYMKLVIEFVVLFETDIIQQI
jgi:hypothetical protein